MKRQDFKEKLLDLLNGNLSPAKENEVIRELEKSGISREEIESMRIVNKLIERTPSPEPSDRMDKRFYTMLEDESLPGEPEVKLKRPIFESFVTSGLKIAAGIALFLLGWFAAGWTGSSPARSKQMTNLTTEVKQLKEALVLTMLQQSSPVERIKAVNMTSEFDDADIQIIESLTEVLNHDNNDNVRLLALDALIRYSSVPEVREKLISSIGNQTSPLILLRFTEIMLALNEKRAVPEFQKVLQNVQLNYTVRGKMTEVVEVLL